MKIKIFAESLVLILLFVSLIHAETTFSENPSETLIMSNFVSQNTSEKEIWGGGFRDYSFNNSTSSDFNQLFKIRLNLKNNILSIREDLIALIKINNLGNYPLIHLNYQIITSNGSLIYSEKSFVMVEGEKILTKTFTNNLPGGNYKLILTIIYNNEITKEITKDFAVQPLSFEEFVNYLLSNNLIGILALSLFVTGLILYFRLFRKLRLEKDKKSFIL